MIKIKKILRKIINKIKSVLIKIKQPFLNHIKNHQLKKNKEELSKVYLYKTGRFQKDFEYLFDNINIIKYIVDTKSECKNDKYIMLKDISKYRKKEKIIICSRKDEKISKVLNNINLIEKKDYYWFEDIGLLLDNDINYEFPETFQRIRSNSELLKEMVYKDAFEDLECKEPFIHVNIKNYGDTYCCCPGYGYNYIGNIAQNELDEVWNSNAAKIFRLSIINKTYAFCDVKNCPFISATNKNKKTNTRFDNLVPEKHPNKMMLAFDKKCNLHCKSCRLKTYIPSNKEKEISKVITEKLSNSDWLEKSNQIIVAGDGEVFFSNLYQELIYNDSLQKRKNLDILTNGVLMTKEKLDKLCDRYENLNVYISIDAANKETYKKLRLGGNFDRLIENIEYLSKLKKEHKVNIVELNFVIQRDNYKEINDFIQMVKKYNFNGANFNCISNWGTFTTAQYNKLSMIDENGIPNDELKEELKKIKKEDYKYVSPSSFLLYYLKNNQK